MHTTPFFGLKVDMKIVPYLLNSSTIKDLKEKKQSYTVTILFLSTKYLSNNKEEDNLMKNKKMKMLASKGLISSALLFTLNTAPVYANEEQNLNQIETQSIIEQQTVPVTEGTNTTVQTETITEGTNTTIQTETTTEVTTAPTPESTVTTTVEEVQAPLAIEQVEEKAPSLIPGDFFYFVKVITEKIRLAVTFDEYEKAQLLADFAAERIQEANALIKEGKTEEAGKLLKEAVATQTLAGEQLPDTTVNVQTTEETSENVATGETVPASEDVAAETTEPTVIVETKLAHNIDALLVVLGKIENEKAKQAILKNIQKSFEKLDKKLSKLAKADEKFAEKMADIEEKLAVGQISEEEADQEKSKLVEELNKKVQKIEDEEERDVEEINDEVEKETTEAISEQKKDADKALEEAEAKQKEETKKAEKKQKEAAKKAAKKEREAAKKQREEAKKLAEKQREEAKKLAEKQREEAKKQAEKQREEAKKEAEKQREENKKEKKSEHKDHN
jgi:hypothetical protein